MVVHISKAVSYTHLDVYKRQLLHQSNNYFAKVGIFFGKFSCMQKYSRL